MITVGIVTTIDLRQTGPRYRNYAANANVDSSYSYGYAQNGSLGRKYAPKRIWVEIRLVHVYNTLNTEHIVIWR